MSAGKRGNGRYDRILELLDLERRVILNGPLTGLKELVERREVVLAEILAREDDAPEDFLAAVKVKAERNSRLILASLAGIKAADAQIAKIEDARDKLRTYTAKGSPVEVRNVAVTRDQRA